MNHHRKKPSRRSQGASDLSCNFPRNSAFHHMISPTLNRLISPSASNCRDFHPLATVTGYKVVVQVPC